MKITFYWENNIPVKTELFSLSNIDGFVLNVASSDSSYPIALDKQKFTL